MTEKICFIGTMLKDIYVNIAKSQLKDVIFKNVLYKCIDSGRLTKSSPLQRFKYLTHSIYIILCFVTIILKVCKLTYLSNLSKIN